MSTSSAAQEKLIQLWRVWAFDTTPALIPAGYDRLRIYAEADYEGLARQMRQVVSGMWAIRLNIPDTNLACVFYIYSDHAVCYVPTDPWVRYLENRKESLWRELKVAIQPC